MQRARRPMVSLLVAGLSFLGAIGLGPVALPALGPAAAVSWPVSAGALIAEVVTGGSSASDEFVEITNAGASTIDLKNTELVYLAAAGTTATRKIAWTASRPLAPGQHLLIANAAGTFAAAADATYANGIAATGGAVALRTIGGAVIDAVGWGDATNAFVEGSAAPAPAASASLERRPGSGVGNGTDTNDNQADFVIQLHPIPQALASAPDVAPPAPTPAASTPAPATTPPVATPAPSISATEPPAATPGITDSPVPSPAETPGPTVEPTPAPSAIDAPPPTDAPTAAPTESPDASVAVPADTAMPTVAPTPDAPTPTPSPTPPPTPSVAPVATDPPVPTAPDSPAPAGDPAPSGTSTPAPAPTLTPEPVASISAARASGDGSEITVEGVLTTGLGGFDADRGAFVQDASAGIGLYLDAAVLERIPRGRLIRVRGTLDQRYAQRILRTSEGGISDLGAAQLPAAEPARTADAAENLEGRRIEVQGTVTAAPAAVADGVSFVIDDGSGPLRIVTAAAPAGLATGSVVRAAGPLGQRDSSGTGSAGYRLYALEPDDVTLIDIPEPTPVTPADPTPAPTPVPTLSPTIGPSPTATPISSVTPAPSATPSATATPAPTPTSSPSPAPTDGVSPILAARVLPSGTTVHIRGVVIGEAGRVGTLLVSIQDASGGIAVRQPAGAPDPVRGMLLDVTGDLASPYGQLELRPPLAAWHEAGSTVLPAPVVIAGALDEAFEGLLVTAQGIVSATPTVSSLGDLSFELQLEGGAVLRVQADATSGIPASAVHRAARYRITGIVGQRASALGRLDGYRIWLRDPDDLVALPAATPSASAIATPSTAPAPSGSGTVTIAAAILAGGPATIEGVAITRPGLLDAAGRTIVIQDTSAAIAVRLPAEAATIRVGRRLRVVGTVGRSYGAPRIVATSVTDLGGTAVPSPIALDGQPTAAVEWRLVTATGMLRAVHRDGDSWKADLDTGGALVLVEGVANADIPAERLRVGARATVTGIVRRPYPSARDRRFALLPRSAGDITVTASVSAPGTAGASASPKPRRTPAGSSGSAAAPEVVAPLDVDLADLAASAGRTVRIGGLIVAINGATLVLDDGTSRATVRFTGDALEQLALLTSGLAVNVVGTAGAGPEPQLVVGRAQDVMPVVQPVSSSGSPPASEVTGLSGDPAGSPESDPPAARFGLSGSQDAAPLDPATETGTMLLTVGILLSLALVGAVALLLRRRPPGGSPGPRAGVHGS